jgi:hypothetical protein
MAFPFLKFVLTIMDKKNLVNNLFYNDKVLATIFLHCKTYVTT